MLEKNSLKFTDKSFCDKSIGEILLTPTKIYVKSCLGAVKTGKIKALSHITGGGLIENLPRVLSDGLDAKLIIILAKPEIFNFLQKLGNIEDEQMHKTFNCGIGMTAIVDVNDVDEIKNIFSNAGEEVVVIGHLQ